MKKHILLLAFTIMATIAFVSANKGGGTYPTGGYTMGTGSGSLFKIPPIKFPTLPLPSFFVSFPPVNDDYGGGGYGYRRR